MYKILLLFIVPLLSACGENEGKTHPVNWSNEQSIKINKELAVEQDIDIKLYLAQHPDWKIVQTGSGLRYYIYKHGDGELAQPGMKAQVETKVSLLDGTVCSQTANDEFEEFEIDKSAVETGVQEGIKKMRVGDKAILIIPSHLAHGLVGDLGKIPPLAVLVVDIHLIGLVK